MKILFMADFSITASDILENKKVFDSYEEVEIDVTEVNLGETKEERASYILRTEQEGPEWTSTPEEVLEKVKERKFSSQILRRWERRSWTRRRS